MLYDYVNGKSAWSFNANYLLQWSGLKQALPDNVHMLTLEQMAGPTFRPTPSQPYLVRFEHIFEKGEDATLSLPIKIVLQVNI